jgi:1-phosphofructokinase
VIVTVTPNPSLDRTLEVERVELGEVLRAQTRLVEPGGKGINVALTLHAHGHETVTVMPCGGAEGEQLGKLLRDEGLETITVPIAGIVRANVAIVEGNGTVTKVNEPGPELTDREIDQLIAAVVDVAGAEWVVAGGSLPPGAPSELFAELTERAHEAGSRVAIDASGAALAAAIESRPDVVKVNRLALAEVTGLPVTTIGEAVTAGEQLRERGAGVVLASLSEDGAVLVDEYGALHAFMAVRKSRSSVGAGNATLAGYLIAADGDRATAIRTAVAFGAAATALPGSQAPTPADVRAERVVVNDPPEARRVLRSASATEIGVPPRSSRKVPIVR